MQKIFTEIYKFRLTERVYWCIVWVELEREVVLQEYGISRGRGIPVKHFSFFL